MGLKRGIINLLGVMTDASSDFLKNHIYDWLPYQCSETQKHVLMEQKRLIVGDPLLVKRLYCLPGSSFAGKEDLVTDGYFRDLEFWKELMLLSRKKVN